MRINSRTGTEGLLVSSVNCDRPLRSGIRAPETVMSTGGPEPVMILPGGRTGYGSLTAVRHRGSSIKDIRKNLAIFTSQLPPCPLLSASA